MLRQLRRKATLIALPWAVLLTTIGCGENGVERHKLTGQVTYQGKPVPVGVIVFTPDTSKGARGPQGYAEITDGKYSTDELGKGAILGPLKIQISGFAATDPSSGTARTMLFPPYKTIATLTKEMETLDFEVPENRRK